MSDGTRCFSHFKGAKIMTKIDKKRYDMAMTTLCQLVPELKPIINITVCKCGCWKPRIYRDRSGRFREYINWYYKGDTGHPGRSHPNWSGGRHKYLGYWYVLKPEPPYVTKRGYVAEHRLVYEEYLGRDLEPREIIHHKDGNKKNNNINNLILTTKWEHCNKYHREDFGQICKKCSSTNIKRGGFSIQGKRSVIYQAFTYWKMLIFSSMIIVPVYVNYFM